MTTTTTTHFTIASITARIAWLSSKYEQEKIDAHAIAYNARQMSYEHDADDDVIAAMRADAARRQKRALAMHAEIGKLYAQRYGLEYSIGRF